jgi:hypothetical protein
MKPREVRSEDLGGISLQIPIAGGDECELIKKKRGGTGG